MILIILFNIFLKLLLGNKKRRQKKQQQKQQNNNQSHPIQLQAKFINNNKNKHKNDNNNLTLTNGSSVSSPIIISKFEKLLLKDDHNDLHDQDIEKHVDFNIDRDNDDQELNQIITESTNLFFSSSSSSPIDIDGEMNAQQNNETISPNQHDQQNWISGTVSTSFSTNDFDQNKVLLHELSSPSPNLNNHLFVGDSTSSNNDNNKSTGSASVDLFLSCTSGSSGTDNGKANLGNKF